MGHSSVGLISVGLISVLMEWCKGEVNDCSLIIVTYEFAKYKYLNATVTATATATATATRKLIY